MHAADYATTNQPLPFTKTAKQIAAIKLLVENLHTMLYGGSRSGKTFIIVFAIVVRALKVKSRHLIIRFRYNHVKRSIWHDTFPKVMKLCFPGEPYKLNEKYGYIEFKNGSQIWFGGIDDKERTEQILGNEYSTIFANECSQISFEAITMLMTRLAEKSGLVNKMFYDCNPPSKKHWSHLLFIDHLDPFDKTPIDPEGYGIMQMNPTDNTENLPDGYIEKVLSRLPRRQRQRFLKGLFLTDVEGALWNVEMIDAARGKEPGEIEERVVGVDPSITNKSTSDLCGIVVAGRDEFKHGAVEKDYSLRGSPNTWATAAINAYHNHMASCIVAEVNQGGDMVETIIHNIDPKVKVVKVHAKQGKLARAEPISAFYERGEVAHADGLDDLESEMMEYVPLTSTESPDRMDACVYALTRLLLTKTPEPTIRVA